MLHGVKAGAALAKKTRGADLRRDPVLAKQFGAKLRKVRCRLGVTQQRLGECSAVTRAQISNLEEGRVLPSLALLYRIANALALNPRELLP